MKHKKNKTIIIGITGSFGTGKTTTAAVFKKLGALILDADEIARGALNKNTPLYRKIIKTFGLRILNKDGAIDRAKLAGLVFGNKKLLAVLCGIVHPVVIKRIKNITRGVKNVPAVVIDAPLLIEAGLDRLADFIIVVKTSRATQVKRAMIRTGFSQNHILSRIKNQMPLKNKIKLADFVIDNEGSKKETEKAVRKIWRELKGDTFVTP